MKPVYLSLESGWSFISREICIDKTRQGFLNFKGLIADKVLATGGIILYKWYYSIVRLGGNYYQWVAGEFWCGSIRPGKL